MSLFSGVGGFEIGFQRAGITTVLQVEKDPWCLGILERHFPHVRRLDDVRKVDAAAQLGGSRDVARVGDSADAERSLAGSRRRVDTLGADSVDLVYGGFPCQDLSVAGQRAGLRGERSGLWSEFARVVSELRPRWVCVENVPGLLSSDNGRDFLRILVDLEQLGYGVAWRVLDARWFGVPQRRRRIFIVGCLGDAARAQAVLAVCESCGGDPAPRREAGERPAYTLAGGSPDTSRRITNGWNTTYLTGPDEVAPTLDNGDRRASVDLPMVAATLSGDGHPESNLPGRHHEDDENLVLGSQVDDGMARPLVARGTGYRMDLESETFLVASPVRASDGHHGRSSGRGDGGDNLVVADQRVGGTGAAALFNAPVVADPISTREGKTYTHEGRINFRTHNVVTAWDDRKDAHHTLRGAGLQRSDVLNAGSGVRRLTPLECERLMGFPDGWTTLTSDGRHVPDSHRYRMCGNAVVATVAEWIGHRLMWVDRS